MGSFPLYARARMEEMGIVEAGRRRVDALLRAGHLSARPARRFNRIYDYLERRPGTLGRILRFPGVYPLLEARFLAGEFPEDAYRRKLLSDFFTVWAVGGGAFVLWVGVALLTGASLRFEGAARIAGLCSTGGLLTAILVYADGRATLSRTARLRRLAEEGGD